MRTRASSPSHAAILGILLALIFVFSSTGVAQIGLSVGLENNEVAPSMYAQGPLDSTGRYLFEFNLLPFSVIPHDHYNDKNSNVSMFPLIRSIPVAAGLLLIGGHDFGKGILPESSFVRGLATALIIPFFLSNSQFHLALAPGGRIPEHAARATAVIGMRTDYFTGETLNWFRFAPLLGIELSTSTDPGGTQQKSRDVVAFAVQAGVTRRIDVSKGFSPRPSASAFVTLKVGWL